MNPEHDHESYMAELRAKFAKEDAANPSAPKRNYLEELRQRANDPRMAANRLFADSERDDVDLGQEFHDENNFADANRAVDSILKSQDEYQVDPMDQDDYNKSDYEYWAEDTELMYTPDHSLSNDDLDAKLYINEPSDSTDWNAVAAEGSKVESAPSAPKKDPYDRPNATFETGGFLHEWWNDGRRKKTAIVKPGTGVSPATDLRPGTN